jgi:hypothetical protein
MLVRAISVIAGTFPVGEPADPASARSDGVGILLGPGRETWRPEAGDTALPIPDPAGAVEDDRVPTIPGQAEG